MTWMIENGRQIGPGEALSPVYGRSDLRAGMRVQVVRDHNRAPAQAVIERVHTVSTNGQRGTVYRNFCTSDDGEEVTDACYTFRDACIHVRYRNGVRAVTDCIAFVRPLDSAVDQLARIAGA